MKRKGEETAIHYGADDNASGAAVVLAMAQTLAQQRKNSPGGERGIIFAFWSGEEIGLIGSSFSPNTRRLRSSNRRLPELRYGRPPARKQAQPAGDRTSSSWTDLSKNAMWPPASLILQEDPYLPTDTTAFYPKVCPS